MLHVSTDGMLEELLQVEGTSMGLNGGTQDITGKGFPFIKSSQVIFEFPGRFGGQRSGFMPCAVN